MSKIGPYSRPHALAKLDGRTREARLMRETRDALVQHVGGNPSATQTEHTAAAVRAHVRWPAAPG